MLKNNKAGFTLVEILVSLAVLGILASGVLPSLIHLRSNINQAISLDQYSSKAQGITDTLVSLLGTKASLSFDTSSQLFNITNLEEPINIGNTFDVNQLDRPQYKITKVFDPADPGNPAKLLGYTVQVRIYYQDQKYVSMDAFADRRGAMWGVG